MDQGRDAKLHPTWFQFHLSTALVMMVVAAGILYGICVGVQHLPQPVSINYLLTDFWYLIPLILFTLFVFVFLCERLLSRNKAP